jgi:hypothetical protein
LREAVAEDMTPDFVGNAGQSLVFARSFYIGHISFEVATKRYESKRC